MYNTNSKPNYILILLNNICILHIVSYNILVYDIADKVIGFCRNREDF